MCLTGAALNVAETFPPALGDWDWLQLSPLPCSPQLSWQRPLSEKPGARKISQLSLLGSGWNKRENQGCGGGAGDNAALFSSSWDCFLAAPCPSPPVPPLHVHLV